MAIPEIKITYTPKLKISQLPIVTDSWQAYQLFKEIWDAGSLQYIEEFKLLLLNRANKVLGIYHVSTGGITNVIIDVRVVFIAALKSCATAMILAHNHPSGNMKPSTDDIMLTKRLKEAGRLLDIAVLDHIILTAEGYASLNELGYM